MQACICSTWDMTRTFATRCVAHYSYDYRNTRRKRTGFLFVECSFVAVVVHASSMKSAARARRGRKLYCSCGARALYVSEVSRDLLYLFVMRGAPSDGDDDGPAGASFTMAGALVYHVTRWWDGEATAQRPLQSSNKRSERSRVWFYALLLCTTRGANIRRGVSRLWKPMKSGLSRVSESPGRPDNPEGARGYLGVCVESKENAIPREDIIIFY